MSSRASARRSSTEGGQPSAELLAVLRAAEKEAGQLSDDYVSTEHLLLALAAQHGRAGDALRAVGATRERLLQALAEVRGPHRVTDQNPEEQVPGARALRPRPHRSSPSRASSTP